MSPQAALGCGLALLGAVAVAEYTGRLLWALARGDDFWADSPQGQAAGARALAGTLVVLVTLLAVA